MKQFFYFLFLFALINADSVAQQMVKSGTVNSSYGINNVTRDAIYFSSNNYSDYSFIIKNKRTKASYYRSDGANYFLFVPKSEFIVIDSVFRSSISNLLQNCYTSSKSDSLYNAESKSSLYKTIFLVRFKSKSKYNDVYMPNQNITIELIRILTVTMKKQSELSDNTKFVLNNMLSNMRDTAMN